jgi:hypothetical protein
MNNRFLLAGGVRIFYSLLKGLYMAGQGTGITPAGHVFGLWAEPGSSGKVGQFHANLKVHFLGKTCKLQITNHKQFPNSKLQRFKRVLVGLEELFGYGLMPNVAHGWI